MEKAKKKANFPIVLDLSIEILFFMLEKAVTRPYVSYCEIAAGMRGLSTDFYREKVRREIAKLLEKDFLLEYSHCPNLGCKKPFEGRVPPLCPHCGFQIIPGLNSVSGRKWPRSYVLTINNEQIDEIFKFIRNEKNFALYIAQTIKHRLDEISQEKHSQDPMQ